ncbi:hypothetical protein [Cohnella nanjingensis]|nr:hypothetical protein [Cohnella nanjingensis]
MTLADPTVEMPPSINGGKASGVCVRNGFWMIPAPGGRTTLIRATAANG